MFEALHKMAKIIGAGYPPEGQFEVYSIAGGDALSKPMHWTRIWREFDSIARGAGGVCNGMDVRRVGEKS